MYFVYKTWIEALFPSAKRTRPSAKKARKSEGAVSTVDANLSGSDSATATGKYDESWIPDHHINRPVAKRVKSSASSKAKKVE